MAICHKVGPYIQCFCGRWRQCRAELKSNHDKSYFVHSPGARSRYQYRQDVQQQRVPYCITNRYNLAELTPSRKYRTGTMPLNEDNSVIPLVGRVTQCEAQ
eukprot:5567555-Amphidinium_carterae.1